MHLLQPVRVSILPFFKQSGTKPFAFCKFRRPRHRFQFPALGTGFKFTPFERLHVFPLVVRLHVFQPFERWHFPAPYTVACFPFAPVVRFPALGMPVACFCSICYWLTGVLVSLITVQKLVINHDAFFFFHPGSCE